MSDRDPERWLRSKASEDAGMSTLLRAGRAEQPSAQQLNALAEKLQATFSTPPSGAGGAAGAGAGGALLAPIGPIVLGTLLAFGVAGAWFGIRGAGEPTPETPPVAPPVPTAQPVPPAAVVRVPAPPVSVSDAVVVDAAPEPPPPARLMPGPVERAQDPAAELALLEQAHRNLAAAPARALDATAAHRRRFPRGQYEQEREVLAIEALLALQRDAQASARAARFLARHPESSHARRVRALVAGAQQAP